MKPKYVLLTLITLLGIMQVRADVEINSENFPDDNFRNYLKNEWFGKDGVITNSEIASISLMIVNNKAISDLKGVEYFTSLRTLYCEFNDLTSLDLSMNIRLRSLLCDNNQLTSIDISMNTELKELKCNNNQLSILDVSNNNDLRVLYCSFNHLVNLNVSKNSILTELKCDNNRLSSLDVSKNNKLVELDCSSNKLTTLDVSKNTALETISCYSNFISGKPMEIFIESLPNVNYRILVILSDINEGNRITPDLMAKAHVKGWLPKCLKGEYYFGL